MGSKILVVEDNEQNLYLVTFLLEKHGYRVVAARTGNEAIAKVLEERPALILMDIHMPEMDGYEATRRIKAHPETADVPIVAVSSYAMSGDRARALGAGCVAYIEKPIAPEGFVAQVERFL